MSKNNLAPACTLFLSILCLLISDVASACYAKTLKTGEKYTGCEVTRDDGTTEKYNAQDLTKQGCLTQCRPLKGECRAVPTGSGESFSACMISIQGGTVHRLTETLKKGEDFMTESGCTSFCETNKRPRPLDEPAPRREQKYRSKPGEAPPATP